MKTNTGFSLLEILIAMAILIIGVASVVNLFPIGLNASKRAADFTSVGILAQAKMAELMYVGYGNWSSIDSDLSGLGTNSGVENTFASPDESYSWHIRLEDPGISNLALATLQIYWLDRGVERYATFITYIADYAA